MPEVMNFGGKGWVSLAFLYQLLDDLPDGFPAASIPYYLNEKIQEEFQKERDGG